MERRLALGFVLIFIELGGVSVAACTATTFPSAVPPDASVDGPDVPDVAVVPSQGDADADTGVTDAANVDPTGMVFVQVKAGAFDYGPPPPGQFDPWPQDTLTRSFYVDRTEVTVGRFKKWLDANMGVPCEGTTCNLDVTQHYAMTWHGEIADWKTTARDPAFTKACAGGTPTYLVDGGASLPMTCVSWYQAAAFCASEGKRLLTQAEWVYVATKGDHRTFPWGDAGPTCKHAITKQLDGGECGWPVDAGSTPLGASPDGVLDLVGSVYEWTWDNAPPEDAGRPKGKTNYLGPDSAPTALGAFKVIAGGDHADNAGPEGYNYNAYAWRPWFGNDSLNLIGIRCAVTAR